MLISTTTQDIQQQSALIGHIFHVKLFAYGNPDFSQHNVESMRDIAHDHHPTQERALASMKVFAGR